MNSLLFQGTVDELFLPPLEESHAPDHGQGKTTFPLSQPLSQNIQLPVKPTKSPPAWVKRETFAEGRGQRLNPKGRGFSTQSFPPASRGCAPSRQARKVGASWVHGDPSTLRGARPGTPLYYLGSEQGGGGGARAKESWYVFKLLPAA